ncbi:MAG: alpha/beta fold hydrolase [Betaproteobacteria bacterium]|nr:alpha/beta fold hydrolase [Betaproteobacteria bacterium]NBY33693.1 alpha/beta fold hydrolase [Betaproteobacteria bacterium]
MSRINETGVSFDLQQFIGISSKFGVWSLQNVEKISRLPAGKWMSFYLMDHVAVEESGTGSPVVCVHGLGGSSNTWSAMHPSLDAHRLIRIDLPGSGRSKLPTEELSMTLLVQCLQTICKRLGITDAQWLGHSMGTIVLQHLAVAEPSLVKSMVLFGPLAEPPEAARENIRNRAEKIRNTGMQGLQEVTESLLTTAVSEHTKRNNPSAYAYVRESLMRQSPLGYAATCDVLSQARSADVERIASPVLLVTGEEDKVSPPEAVRALARRMGSAKSVVLTRCGHWTPIEKPHECAREARAFLKRHA